MSQFLGVLREFDGRLERDSASALAFSLFIDALNDLDADGAYQLTLSVVDDKPVSPAHRDLLISAVKKAHQAFVTTYGSSQVYGDRFRLARGERSWAGSGGSFIFQGMEKHLDLQGGWNNRPFIAAPPRTMRFRAQSENANVLTAYCCQRVPFVVAFRSGKPVTSYSQFLPGLSDDPASLHFDDQLELASEGKLRSNHFELNELLPNIRSSTVLTVKH